MLRTRRSGHGISSLILVVLAWVALCPSTGSAETCTVPGTHATVQEACDDLACDTIQLAAQTYPESIDVVRTMSLEGDDGGVSTVEGMVQAMGTGVTLTLRDLHVRNGCHNQAMLAVGGAQIDAIDVEVERSGSLPCPWPPSWIFLDGFESGDITGWD